MLIGKTPVESVLQNAGRNLAVLTSGPLPPNPSELLLSEQAQALIASIAEQVDFVILDTPPLLPVADGAEMAIIADATVLVHRAGKTHPRPGQRAVQALAKVDRRPVGAILNMVTRSGARYGYEYGYYYVDYAARPQRSRSRQEGRQGPAVGQGAARSQASCRDGPRHRFHRCQRQRSTTCLRQRAPQNRFPRAPHRAKLRCPRRNPGAPSSPPRLRPQGRHRRGQPRPGQRSRPIARRPRATSG